MLVLKDLINLLQGLDGTVNCEEKKMAFFGSGFTIPGSGSADPDPHKN